MLGPGGWASDVLLKTNAAGQIVSLENGRGEGADLVLTGPVIPGMPNCHSHAFQRQMAGLAGRPGPHRNDSFWTWREAMYRLANRVSPDDLADIARWLYIEMLESGYTSCAEFHYLHHAPDGRDYDPVDETGARLLDAATAAGIGLTLLPVLYCRSGFGAGSIEPGQVRFAAEPDRFLRLFEHSLDRVKDEAHHVVGLAFHSLRAVSEAHMSEVLQAEAGRASSIHIHIAEQRVEVEQCLEALGARPVEWLLDHAPANERWCLVHATHMDTGECRSAAQRGVVAGLCPTTEADLGDGFFEAGHWQEHGGKIAVGSDSNLRVSPREELRLLEFGLRLRSGRRNVFGSSGRGCGRDLYEAAAVGGGVALGQAVGRLEAGFRADLVELDPESPLLAGVDVEDVVDRYVFAGNKSMVRTVCVGGEQRVYGGRHPQREEAAEAFSAVMEDYQQ